MSGPPVIAQWILTLALDPEDLPFALSDLEEDFHSQLGGNGPNAARRWYWHQTLHSIAPSLGRRIQKRWTRMATTRSWPTAGGRFTMDPLRQDTRYAFRTLVRRPGFTAVAALTLALGIGANGAIFSIVNGMLFKGVPGLTNTTGLVEISRNIGGSFWDQSYPTYEHLRENSETLSDVAAMVIAPVAIGDGGESSVHMALAVTGNYLSVLDVAPAMGRFFAPDESFYPTVTPTAVITHAFWERRFDAAPDIIGKTMYANGEPIEIIGVTAPGLAGHSVGLQLDLFVPLGLAIPGLPEPSGLESATNGTLEMIGRLQAGASAQQAQAELSGLANQFMTQYVEPGTPEYVMRVENWAPVPAIIRKPVIAFFSIMMVIVSLVLTMACVNVAGMLLARSVERRTEIAVRLAMGASRMRIVRQLLTESLVLFVVAGTLGVLAASWATSLLLTFQPPLPIGITVALDVGMDWRVVAFAFGISIGAGMLFSIAPALRATRSDLVSALKDRTTGAAPVRSRMRSVLVAGQTAITLVLLVVAGLFLRALSSMEGLDPGWDAEDVVVMNLDLELIGANQDVGTLFYRELTERANALQGVEISAIAGKLPLAGRGSLGQVNTTSVDPPPGQVGHDAYYNRVSPGYFDVLHLQLIAGRDIAPADRAGTARVAVINNAMAERLWPGRNAIGANFYLGKVGEGRAFEVIGVVENAKYNRLVEETPNFYYLPFEQRYNAQMVLYIRTLPGAEQMVANGVREVIEELNAALPVQPFRPLREALEVFFLPQRIAAWVAGAMGLVGLLLGAVGVYGITAFVVGQRSREIGLRIALGARSNDVLRTVVRQGMIAPFVGMLIGLLASAALSQAMSGFLAGIAPIDPLTFGSVIVILLTVATGANLIPARRAAALDPMSVLRAE